MLTTTAIAVIGLAMTAASTGAALYSADTQAKQAESNLKYQSAQTAADAAAAAGEAQVEAGRIRKAATAQRAQATAAAAASGIDINSPTALKIDEGIQKSGEEDALLTILNGGDRSGRMANQATVYGQGAKLARSEGRQQQAATLLSGAATATGQYSNWKKG